MARNEEKAQAMLNRFVQAHVDVAKGPREKRPYLASLCETLGEAERWRHQILGEVAKKVSMIQNTSLGEFRCDSMQPPPVTPRRGSFGGVGGGGGGGGA
jgi:pre-mRNA-splicing factor ISY1